MKKVVRRALSEETVQHLQERQARIDVEDGADARKQRAKRLWRAKTDNTSGARAFSEVTAVLRTMCNARGRCMYCEDSAGSDVDHVKPQSRYPEETFVWENYLWACSVCNSRYKRDHYHDAFMDPSAPDYDLWERWRFDPKTGDYRAIHETDEGAHATLWILGFDERRADLAIERRAHLDRAIWWIRRYAVAKEERREEDARKFARDLRQSHFPAVTEWLLKQDFPLDEAPQEIRKGLEDVLKVRKMYPQIVEDVLGA